MTPWILLVYGWRAALIATACTALGVALALAIIGLLSLWERIYANRKG